MLGLGSRAVADTQPTPSPPSQVPAPPSNTKTGIAAAVNAIATAVAAVGKLASASLAQLAPVSSAVSTVLPLVTAAVSQFDTSIPTTTFAGMVVGLPVPALVGALQSTTVAAQQQGVALGLFAYLSRMQANLNAATG